LAISLPYIPPSQNTQAKPDTEMAVRESESGAGAGGRAHLGCRALSLTNQRLHLHLHLHLQRLHLHLQPAHLRLHPHLRPLQPLRRTWERGFNRVYLKFNRDFNTVLKIQQGFLSKGSFNSTGIRKGNPC
jgi:hypothetical protein